MGRSDECPECGFYNATGDRFCSHDCAASYADRCARMAAAEQARRDREAAFGRAVDELHAAGHTDEEIDVLLAGMPT
jgi:hypothetical protein